MGRCHRCPYPGCRAVTSPPAAKRKLLHKPSRFSLAATSVRYFLWLEGNYLVHTTTEGYTESSKRFALIDIQAIVITQTHWRAWGNVLIVAAAGLLNIAILSISPEWQIAGLVLTPINSVLAILMAANTLSGPICVTHLYTAVQVEHLRGCRRLPGARKMLGRLASEISRVQGELGQS